MKGFFFKKLLTKKLKVMKKKLNSYIGTLFSYLLLTGVIGSLIPSLSPEKVPELNDFIPFIFMLVAFLISSIGCRTILLKELKEKAKEELKQEKSHIIKTISEYFKTESIYSGGVKIGIVNLLYELGPDKVDFELIKEYFRYVPQLEKILDELTFKNICIKETNTKKITYKLAYHLTLLFSKQNIN